MTGPLKCTWCEELLAPEEIADRQNRDDAGERICDECVRREYYEQCGSCGEDFDKRDSALSHFVVLAPEGAPSSGGTAEPGYYRALRKPFYTEGLVGSGWLHDWRIQFIAPLRGDEADDDWAPCAFLCAECIERVDPPLLMASGYP